MAIYPTERRTKIQQNIDEEESSSTQKIGYRYPVLF